MSQFANESIYQSINHWYNPRNHWYAVRVWAPPLKGAGGMLYKKGGCFYKNRQIGKSANYLIKTIVFPSENFSENTYPSALKPLRSSAERISFSAK